jgi:ArpU family phage transcriptional regulator
MLVAHQMSFKLPKIDREATKDAVEEALEKYRMYLLLETEEQLPKVTSTYSLTPPSNTNVNHSSTENAAVSNVDFERQRRQYLKVIQKAVNRLGYFERAILIQRYMTCDDVYDYEVFNDLGMSERKYYRLKGRTFYKLAFMLKIEIYQEKEVVPS